MVVCARKPRTTGTAGSALHSRRLRRSVEPVLTRAFPPLRKPEAVPHRLSQRRLRATLLRQPDLPRMRRPPPRTAAIHLPETTYPLRGPTPPRHHRSSQFDFSPIRSSGTLRQNLISPPLERPRQTSRRESGPFLPRSAQIFQYKLVCALNPRDI